MTLPPLPEPDTHCFDGDTGLDVWSHSPDQMRAYGEACAAAERRGSVEMTDVIERAQAWLLEIQRGSLEGYRNTHQGVRAYRVLRQAVDAMMAPLGYHGTISARDDRVQAVMDALAQIDQEERE